MLGIDAAEAMVPSQTSYNMLALRMLVEIPSAMKLAEVLYSGKFWTLGVSSALMNISDYPCELEITGDPGAQWEYR